MLRYRAGRTNQKNSRAGACLSIGGCLWIGNNRASSVNPARQMARAKSVVVNENSATARHRLSEASQPTGGRYGDGERMNAGQRGGAAGARSIDAQLPLLITAHRRRSLASWQVNTAKAMLRARISGQVAIADIAAACGLSPTYFIKAFADTVGVAPYEWFLDQRIAQACMLIDNTALSLAEISIECGFSDQSHLTRTFVKRRGITPARWRLATRLALEKKA